MRPERAPAVYIMASGRNGTLYVGVTSALITRVATHRAGTSGGFAARYRCTRLVWFEQHASMEAAILREKQLKAGSRATKIKLIEAANPQWHDLYVELL